MSTTTTLAPPPQVNNDTPLPPPSPRRPRYPPPPPRKRRIFLPLFATVIAVLGIIFAVAPSFFQRAHVAIGGGELVCPQSIRVLRNSWDFNEMLKSVTKSVKLLFVARPRPAVARIETASGLPLWEAADLARYRGEDGSRVTLGVCSRVYDVTELGGHFYGPGKGYSIFAGKDATRALALGSLGEDELARGGDVSGIDDATVQSQCEFYNTKYGPPIGVLAKVESVAETEPS